MVSSCNPTYKQQAAYQHSSSKNARHTTESPSPPLEASKQQSSTPHHFGQLADSDLFVTLLFDRQRAYQRAPSVLPITRRLPAAQVKDITYHKQAQSRDTSRKRGLDPPGHSNYQETYTDDESNASGLGFRDKTMVPKTRVVSTKRGRSTKKETIATKSKGKTTADTPKKRRAPARAASARNIKCQKTEANSKRKLGCRSSVRNGIKSLMTKPLPASEEIITISSDEEDKEEGAIICRTPKRHVTPDDIKFESEAMITQPQPQPRSESTPPTPERMPLAVLASNDEWGFGSLDPEPSVSLSKPQPDLAHVQEVRRLRKEVDTANTKIEQITQHYERDKKYRELERVRSESLTNKRYSDVLRELDSMERRLKRTETERDQLQIVIGNEKSKCEALGKELQKEKDESKITLQDVIKKREADSQTSNASLREENTRLRNEVESLKLAAATASSSSLPASANPLLPPSQSIFPLSPISPTTSTFHASSIQNRATPSPAPWSVSEEERKVENIRKMYITVKRRFDNIQFAASKLAECTRSMDLSSFGEFGRYLKELRSVLDENGKDRMGVDISRAVMVRERETEDWK